MNCFFIGHKHGMNGKRVNYTTRKVQKQTLHKVIRRRPTYLKNLGPKPTWLRSRPSQQPTCKGQFGGGIAWVRPHPGYGRTPNALPSLLLPCGPPWCLLHDGCMGAYKKILPKPTIPSLYIDGGCSHMNTHHQGATLHHIPRCSSSTS